MKLCMKGGKFVHIKNMSKEQLCRVTVSQISGMSFRARKVYGAFEKQVPGYTYDATWLLMRKLVQMRVYFGKHVPF